MCAWLAAADCLFEEVTPAALLDDRPCENGTRDFLVQWSDGAEDSWVWAHWVSGVCLCPTGACSGCSGCRHITVWLWDMQAATLIVFSGPPALCMSQLGMAVPGASTGMLRCRGCLARAARAWRARAAALTRVAGAGELAVHCAGRCGGL